MEEANAKSGVPVRHRYGRGRGLGCSSPTPRSWWQLMSIATSIRIKCWMYVRYFSYFFLTLLTLAVE